MAPWDSRAQRETWEPLGQLELLDPKVKKATRAEDLLSKEKRVKRVPWARLVPLGETAAKACGGSQESRGCLVRWACGDSMDPQDFPALPDTLELLVSKENEGKGEPEEKRGSEAWMDSPGSAGRLESREGLALLVRRDPRERRVMWGLQDHLVYQALWCRKRA